MSNQVKRWQSAKDYTEGRCVGVPVSEKLNTWEEAEEIRNRLRKEDPQHYYNIVHYTQCAIIDSPVGVYPSADEYEHKELGE